MARTRNGSARLLVPIDLGLPGRTQAIDIAMDDFDPTRVRLNWGTTAGVCDEPGLEVRIQRRNQRRVRPSVLFCPFYGVTPVTAIPTLWQCEAGCDRYRPQQPNREADGSTESVDSHASDPWRGGPRATHASTVRLGSHRHVSRSVRPQYPGGVSLQQDALDLKGGQATPNHIVTFASCSLFTSCTLTARRKIAVHSQISIS